LEGKCTFYTKNVQEDFIHT